MMLKVGFAELLGTTKQGQGFREGTFVKNSEHSCQSYEYIQRLHVERRSISKRKGLHYINFVKYNISFIVFCINLNKDAVILPIMSKDSIAKKFENPLA